MRGQTRTCGTNDLCCQVKAQCLQGLCLQGLCLRGLCLQGPCLLGSVLMGLMARCVCVWLDVEEELEQVAVLDDVVLALRAQLACFLGACLAVVGDKVVVGDGLGANEATLEV